MKKASKSVLKQGTKSAEDRPSPPDEILTVQEAAAFLKLHPVSVYRLIARRQLPAYRIGSDIRLNRRRLMEFLEQSAQQLAG